MRQIPCPMCDSLDAQEVTYSETIQTERGDVLVENLRRFRCPSCETVFADDAQTRHNLVRTQLATGEEPRYLLPEKLYAWRTNVGLTQRECARLFGGGSNAFSKYENGEVAQSESMDNLLWLAIVYPGVIVALAKRRHVDLAPRVTLKCGHLLQSWGSQGASAAQPVLGRESVSSAAVAATTGGQMALVGGQLRLHPGAGLQALYP